MSTFNPNFSIAAGIAPAAIAAVATPLSVSVDPTSICRDVLVYNPGPAIVRIRAGASNVTAGATDMPILPGEKAVYFKGTATHISAICMAAGPQAMEFFPGVGE
ncbi:hypothetical protein UFOVP708_5 [uncultured Caudovirales phage]|uniref:Uncharacterized protein n=1 Tax=uncultured Caudovirales phage TaxID=2100421 RepID=A0A6J5NFF6_9CAUD|nr:hypothetical protein UFOVP708_5 [uncultured Caudovirales phage]